MSHSTAIGPTRAWIIAARLPTLTAAIVPVAVGSACAYSMGGLKIFPAIAALIGAIFIQIGTNFANDVFDFESGADTEDRLGPMRATQAGLLTPMQMRRGMWVTFGVSVLAGAYLTYLGGWPILVVGILSILSGIAYTGGPYPLGYNGLGDLFVMIFFGFVAVCGTAFVQLGFIPDLAWWASIPVGCLATAILVVNNVRDAETDALVGKRTLAVRFGTKLGKIEYIFILALGYAVPLALWTSGRADGWILLPLATLPLAMKQIRILLHCDDGPSLNGCLKGSAQLLGLFGLLFALGIVL